MRGRGQNRILLRKEGRIRMKKEEREALLREKLRQMSKLEQALTENGIGCIAGVEEVGRGPLAGPVVAAAVVLPPDFSLLGVDDSKKLSEKKRETLAVQIRELAWAIGIGRREPARIDEINILEATKEAMTDAVREAGRLLRERFGPDAEIGHVLLDAVHLDGLGIPQTSLIHGDARSVSIAAASIIAKVERDHRMMEYAEEYPDYLFEKNKGYGTKAHYEGIKRVGICPIHRRTFLKNVPAASFDSSKPSGYNETTEE